MKAKLIVPFALFIVLFTQGCVSASKHEKLQQDYDQSKLSLDEANRLLATDEGKILEDKNKLQELEVFIKELQAKLSDAESKLGLTSTAKKKLEGNISEMKTALEALTKQRTDAEKRIQEFRDFVRKFKSLTDTGKLTVKMIDGQMVVTLSSDVLFASGSARLSVAGIESIQQVTALLTSVGDRKFQIEGFTDNIPIHTQAFPSNWELASARALTVVKTMLETGMPPEHVSAASFGETHPVQSNDTAEGRAANRRIEIVVVPDLSTLPGYDQLQKMSSP